MKKKIKTVPYQRTIKVSKSATRNITLYNTII